MTLTAWLIAQQGEDTNRVYAERLGISPHMWGKIRKEQRGASSIRLLRGAIRAFPDRYEEILRVSVGPATGLQAIRAVTSCGGGAREGTD